MVLPRALVLAAGLLTSPVGGQALVAQSVPSLADVSFLVGCWDGRMGALHMMEQWTSAEGGLMFYTTRFVRDDAIVDFEFGRLQQDESGLTLWPYPRGVASEHGFPLVSTGDEYVFENLEHDFPVRIIYARVGEDGLEPRIEGADGSGTGWSLQRVTCPG